ncbi:MAG: hypothetical protein AB1730_01935 [Myxococcota bacterium]
MNMKRLSVRSLVTVVVFTLAACGGMESGTDGGTGGGSGGGAMGGGSGGGGGDADAGTGGGGGGDADAGTGGGGGATDAGTGGGGGDVDAGTGGGGGMAVTVSEITGNTSAPYAGQLINLSLTVTGAMPVIHWTQTGGPMGTFDDNSGPTARWYSPEVTTATLFTLEAQVGVSPPETKTITFTVNPPKFSEVWADILNPTCRVCHGFIGATPATGYTQLVGVNHQRGAACNNTGITKRVEAGSKTNSLLFRKVERTQPGTCGNSMPQGGMLPTNEVIAIGAWIAAGAPNN